MGWNRKPARRDNPMRRTLRRWWLACALARAGPRCILLALVLAYRAVASFNSFSTSSVLAVSPSRGKIFSTL